MKTYTTLLIAAAAAFSLNANADPLMDIIHPESADIFQLDEGVIVPQELVFVEDTGKEVWSVEYEQYVNPADFNSTTSGTIASALQQLKNNPPAAGQLSAEVFKWDEVADEYQVQ